MSERPLTYPKSENFFKLILCIAGCELVGILGTPFTVASIPTWYAGLVKPFFAPPNWLFGPAWAILYFLMGTSFYIIIKREWKKKEIKNATKFFIAQLALNFIWSPIFFGLRSPLLGLIIIVAMWSLIFVTAKKFYPISKLASYLLLPYLLWVSYATLLNASIWILN